MSDFAARVYAYLHPEQGYSSRRDWWQKRDAALAEYFECAAITVERWADGTATPHPLLQAQIIAWMAEHS